MRVFVTGAAGFIGAATTKELIANGHQVVGLARSDANAATLKAAGADVHRGSLEDLDSLRKGAKETDGTIHLAFIHDFAKFAENGQIDKRAIEAMGDVLVGTNKPFIVTSGTGLIAPNVLITEDIRRDASAHVPRVSEEAGLAYAKRGVRAMTVRLHASRTALAREIPGSIWVWMFSISTVASSTRTPTASARPPRVMTLIVCPAAQRKRTAVSNAKGILATTINAPRQSRKKSRTTSPVSPAPRTASRTSPLIALET